MPFKILFTFWFFLLGSAIGSFLNVLIYRLPRKESILFPPSHCPSCNHKLASKDLFPIFSYIFLKGRCRYCGAKISIRYPLVEILTAIFFALSFWLYGWSFYCLKILIFFSLLLPIFFIDLEHMLIHDVLSFTGLGLGLFLSLLEGKIYQSILGSIVFGGVLLLIYLGALFILKEEGMGQGDIKLGFLLGSFLGLKLSLLALFLSYILGGIISIFILLFKDKNLKTAIPFGPFLILGSFISLFWGESIISFYLSLFIK
jgi:leader peptidase (prepilin peptidase)/N-methyltransferase